MGYRTLLREHRGLLSIAFLAMFTSSLGQSYFVGLFQAPIADQLGLSAGEFGTAYSIVSLTAGFAMLRFGPRIDWVSPRRFAGGVLIALLLGILLLTWSPFWLLGLLGLGLVRLAGQGMMPHLGNTLAGRGFSALRGRAIGLVSTGMMLGEALLPPLAAALLIWLGWRELWWLFALLLAALWLPLLWRGAWPETPAKPSASRQVSGLKPFRERHFWQLLPMWMILPAIMTGLFLYQAQMTEALGSTLAIYALALTLRGPSKLPGALLGGRWVDRLGPVRMARLYHLPFVIALIMALMQGGHAGVMALMIGSGLTMGAQESIATSLLVKRWGTAQLGTLRAALSASMVFATGLTPAVMGLVLDLGISFQQILLGMLVLLIISWLMAQPVLRAIKKTPTDDSRTG